MPDLTMPKPGAVVQPQQPTALEQPQVQQPVVQAAPVQPQQSKQDGVEKTIIPFDDSKVDTETFAVVHVQGNTPAFSWQGICKQCPFMAREATKGAALSVIQGHVSGKHGA